MAQPFTVSFPPNLVITDGWMVTITALNAGDGSVMAGVRITEALIEVEQLAGGDLSSGAFKMLKPVLLTQA